MKEKDVFSSLNIPARCHELRVGLWQCPHFLFVVMGIIIAGAIVATHVVAERYADPEMAVSIVFLVTIVLFIISHIIVNAFEKMAQSSRLKSEFISIISHELRTPLSSIKWQLNLLSEAREELAIEDFTKAFRVVGEENEKMIALINDLLDIDRIEDKAFPFAPSAFSLTALARETTGEFEAIRHGSGPSLNFLDPKQDLFVKADRAQVKSVIRRLVDNALRYSRADGEVTTAIEDMGSEVRLSVSDQGKGVPEEEIKRVFSKFFRGSNLKYQTSGLGLGLFISKYVIEASGGKMDFRSIEGRGSTFFFTLPKTG